MIRYRVTHRTHYAYEAEVGASWSQAHLLLRDAPGQRVLDAALHVDPTPDHQRERRDLDGNRVVHVAVTEPYEELTVVATGTVDVARPPAPEGAAAWEAIRDQLAVDAPNPSPAALEARRFVLPSPRVRPNARTAAWATPSLEPDAPIGVVARDLTHRLFTEFSFDPSATTVSTTSDEFLDAGGGVCQDFAHLLIGALRASGLAARYVSGYLETDPPPGKPKLRGADASHAWVSVWAGDEGWLDVDPTNDQVVGDRHVIVGWGRDYADLAPLQGVVFTDSTKDTMTVAVDVERVDEGIT